MFDPNRPGHFGYTTANLVRACEAAEVRLAPVAAIVAPLARTRPDAPVQPDLIVLARQALRPAQRLAIARDVPPLLPLHPPVTHAVLAARLALATTLAADFRVAYFRFHEKLRARCWHVGPWLEWAVKERTAEAWLEGYNSLAEMP